MNKKEFLKETVNSPMSNDEINKYLPNAKIIRYSDLSSINHIDELLTKEKDYVILLYETQPNVGHWTVLLKYPHSNTYEYFDSYGKPLDNPLKWNSKQQNEMLNQKPYLKNLLNSAKLIQNKTPFQIDKLSVQTCGRHIIFRILKFLLDGLDLEEYTKYMKFLKKSSNHSYDDIVSAHINDISTEYIEANKLDQKLEGGSNRDKIKYNVIINNNKFIVKVSNRKNKKYDVYDSNNNYIVSFGDKRYQHYRDLLGYYENLNHNDLNRRYRYIQRHKNDNLTDIKSAGFWSMYFLW